MIHANAIVEWCVINVRFICERRVILLWVYGDRDHNKNGSCKMKEEIRKKKKYEPWIYLFAIVFTSS